MICPACHGDGKVRGRWYIFKVTCQKCNGVGTISSPFRQARREPITWKAVDPPPPVGMVVSQDQGFQDFYIPTDFGAAIDLTPSTPDPPSFDPGGGESGGAGASGSWDPPPSNDSFNN